MTTAKLKPTEYRGFCVNPVFDFQNGKGDFEFYRLSDPEESGLMRFKTLEYVKAEINARLEDRPEMFEVNVTRDVTTVCRGLLNALDYARFWKGNLIAEFKNI